jgi:L-seryl-tRNA(Ser) seleniumtransferase
MYRALRVDKLTLAALEATLVGPPTPTHSALHAPQSDLAARVRELAASLEGLGIAATVAPSVGVVGGGGAPQVTLPGWAVELPAAYAEALRHGRPAVVGRVERGHCVLDLRCIAPGDDAVLLAAITAARSRVSEAGAPPCM